MCYFWASHFFRLTVFEYTKWSPHSLYTIVFQVSVRVSLRSRASLSCWLLVAACLTSRRDDTFSPTPHKNTSTARQIRRDFHDKCNWEVRETPSHNAQSLIRDILHSYKDLTGLSAFNSNIMKDRRSPWHDEFKFNEMYGRKPLVELIYIRYSCYSRQSIYQKLMIRSTIHLWMPFRRFVLQEYSLSSLRLHSLHHHVRLNETVRNITSWYERSLENSIHLV